MGALSVAYVSGSDTESEVMKSGVKTGEYQLVFFTPELIIGTHRRSPEYTS